MIVGNKGLVVLFVVGAADGLIPIGIGGRSIHKVVGNAAVFLGVSRKINVCFLLEMDLHTAPIVVPVVGGTGKAV